MTRLLLPAPVDDETRRANDTRRSWVVACVLGVLLVYVYLFTHAAGDLGLPWPEDLAADFGLEPRHVFDDDHNVDSNVSIRLTRRFNNDDERLLFLVVLMVAFLCAYYLPLERKRPSLVFWSLVGIAALYGWEATAGILGAHLAVYAVLHPHGPSRQWMAAGAALGITAALADPDRGLGPAWMVIAPVVAWYGYGTVVAPLLARPQAGRWLRTGVIQSAILVTCIAALGEGLTDGDWEWRLPLGLLLFFWQWERLIVYHVDYKEGLIPDAISLPEYLSVFFSPGAIPNWNWGVTIGQGYAYLDGNYLCEDKNRLALTGIKMMLLALVYLVGWNWVRHLLVDLFTSLDVPVHRAVTRQMVRDFMDGDDISTASVLATTFLDLTRWTMLWAGVVHFKVGVWNVCGYRMDPYINRPWTATNLSVLWSRFTFHYRLFLMRAFYFPVFFRVFRRRKYLRTFVATVAAAGVGNLVWGHIPERLYYRGLEWENITYVLGTWPYFVLLAGGIGLTQMYLMKRRARRKPWTRDWWLVTDVLAVYCTLQYYALIHIYARPADGSTVWDLTRLFLRGFGIHLDG